MITHAKRIIAISQNTKEDIIQLLHISPEKIDVIYHSTSMKPFTGKQRLTLPDSFYFLSETELLTKTLIA